MNDKQTNLRAENTELKKDNKKLKKEVVNRPGFAGDLIS
jgi:hypothetical protein